MATLATASALLTWRDYVALPEDDRRELVDGRLEEGDVPTKWHERICIKLAVMLDLWAEAHGHVVVGSGYRVRISNKRGAMPDLQMFKEEVYARAGANGLEDGHPELVVEVVSPGSRSRDQLRKLDWYAQRGFPEYWIVDPEMRSLVVHRLQDGVYAIVQHDEGDSVFRSKTFKGVKVPLAKLWQYLEA